MKYYHGSNIFLPVGTILVPQQNYEISWGQTDFYPILEQNRPKHCLAHKNAVFMCASDEDIDLAGGGTEYVFVVKPLGPVSKHDINWSSEISVALCEKKKSLQQDLIYFSTQYWSGVSHNAESVWEYLTTSAEVLSVEEF